MVSPAFISLTTNRGAFPRTAEQDVYDSRGSQYSVVLAVLGYCHLSVHLSGDASLRRRARVAGFLDVSDCSCKPV